MYRNWSLCARQENIVLLPDAYHYDVLRHIAIVPIRLRQCLRDHATGSYKYKSQAICQHVQNLLQAHDFAAIWLQHNANLCDIMRFVCT